MQNPFKYFLSWLYHKPEDCLKARIEQRLDDSSFVSAYRPGVATMLRVLHEAGLDVEGLIRVVSIGLIPLTLEHEATAQRALAAGDLGQMPASNRTFDINADYFQVLLVTHMRGTYAGLYYLPVEFNGNVSKLNTVWVHAFPSSGMIGEESLEYVVDFQSKEPQAGREPAYSIEQ